MQPNYHIRDFLNMYAEKLLIYNDSLLNEKMQAQKMEEDIQELYDQSYD